MLDEEGPDRASPEYQAAAAAVFLAAALGWGLPYRLSREGVELWKFIPESRAYFHWTAPFWTRRSNFAVL